MAKLSSLPKSLPSSYLFIQGRERERKSGKREERERERATDKTNRNNSEDEKPFRKDDRLIMRESKANTRLPD
jgi:hypothetical protein